MKSLKELSNEELIEISDLFLNYPHSDGFRISEAKDIFTDWYLCFSSIPKQNWKENIIKYLTDKGYELPKNKLFE